MCNIITYNTINVLIAGSSAIAAIAAAIAAWRSVQCTEKQKEITLFNRRCSHIKHIKLFWKNFNKDICYIPNYKAYVSADNTPAEEIEKYMHDIVFELEILNIETLNLFNKQISELECDLINSIKRIIPSQEWSVYHVEEQYKESIKIYIKLLGILEKFLNSNGIK